MREEAPMIRRRLVYVPFRLMYQRLIRRMQIDIIMRHVKGFIMDDERLKNMGGGKMYVNA